jgi:hypothetical protein
MSEEQNTIRLSGDVSGTPGRISRPTARLRYVWRFLESTYDEERRPVRIRVLQQWWEDIGTGGGEWVDVPTEEEEPPGEVHVDQRGRGSSGPSPEWIRTPFPGSGEGLS